LPTSPQTLCHSALTHFWGSGSLLWNRLEDFIQYAQSTRALASMRKVDIANYAITHCSRGYLGTHTMDRRLDRILASAASTLLVASREQLMQSTAHQRSGPASRLLMTRPHYHTITLTNPDIFKLLNIKGICPYTQPRTVNERQAVASSHLALTANSEQGSTSVCRV
jgi:hypothetical protein